MTATPEAVAAAFLIPRAPRHPEALSLADGEAIRIATPQGDLALQRAGTGPVVLLLHGWEGQPADMAAFAPVLRDAGFSVVVMHLPAHGDSTGTATSLPECARALGAVGRALGALHAVVAHSMGAAIAVEALHSGLDAERVVLIAAPARYEHYVRSFATAAGLDGDGSDAVLAWLDARIGTPVRDVSVPARAPALRQPALFIHSGDDRVVSIDDSVASAAAWPGARHLRVDGLGHRRLLTDPDVLAAAVDFVSAARSPALNAA